MKMKLLAAVVALTLVLTPTASANANTQGYVSGIVVNQPSWMWLPAGLANKAESGSLPR